MQAGYAATLRKFLQAEPSVIQAALGRFVSDADASQKTAWRDSLAIVRSVAENWTDVNHEVLDNVAVIFEYRIPLESRRIDCLILGPTSAAVLEFKGKPFVSQADFDQADGYARDLRAYHAYFADKVVHAALIATRLHHVNGSCGPVDLLRPSDLAGYLQQRVTPAGRAPELDEILSLDAYQPLPTLVRAARELFSSGTLKRIHRAAAVTEPTLDACNSIVHRAAEEKRKALILISGVPGAGKTLVGLQLAHAAFLDDLSVGRKNGEKPTAPAVYLSGNAPLVEVLQYELRAAGGDGKSFVRGVHEYVRTFTARATSVPPQHVLIYDEAQRAFDAEQVSAKHKDLPSEFAGMSEPELFIKFAERVPDWCVVIGLVGTGQEIHVGEEGGMGQWRSAIQRSSLSQEWDVYGPDSDEIAGAFHGLQFNRIQSLELKETIRFHLATKLYDFVHAVLEGQAGAARAIAAQLTEASYQLRITSDLDTAKQYLWDRFEGNGEVRYGMIASSRDKDLAKFDVPKGFKSPGEVNAGKYGRWYANAKGETGSCSNLDTVATEFGAQGLELDGCLLAWGTDFIRTGDTWSNQYASRYQQAHRVRDAKELRKNAYRVLLTRGREVCVVYVPPMPQTRETYEYLVDCGFLELRSTRSDEAIWAGAAAG